MIDYDPTELLESIEEIKEENSKQPQQIATSNVKSKAKKTRVEVNHKYRIVFDDDLEDFAKNYKEIFDISQNRWLNSLVRKDLNRILGTQNLKGDDLLNKWLEYKKENNIK